MSSLAPRTPIRGPALALAGALALVPMGALAQSSPEANTLHTADNLSYSGAGSLTLGYGLGVFIGGTQLASCSAAHGVGCYLPSNWMFAPLVGPWISLADGGLTPEYAALWVVDGVLQLAGAALLLTGGAMRASVRSLRSSSYVVTLLPAGPGFALLGAF